MHLDGDRVVIEAVSTPRVGWFDNFQPGAEEDAWNEMKESDKESGEWVW